MSGWPLMPLGNICDVVGGGTPSRGNSEFFGGEIPWITPTDVTRNDGRYLDRGSETITELGLQNSSAKLLPARSVLLTSRATIGFTAINTIPVTTNQGFASFICGPDIWPEYLAYWLEWSRRRLVELASGATFKEINKSTLKKLPIPLPPLKEQRRIVSLLDRAADIRRRADAARAKARAIIPALFLDMFGDPATNPKGWPTQRLAELADIGSGLTKGRKLNGSATIPTPYLRVANVQADRLDLSQIKLIDATEDDRQRCRLATNDLLMTEGGDIDKLGRCAIWRGQIDLCLHQNHVFRVRMGKSVVPAFAQAFMQCEAARGYFLRVAKRTTGIASINKTQLGKLPVWVPPLPLQSTFANQAQRLETTVGALDAAATRAKEMAEALSNQVFA